ncbi:MAG: hypothetical protein IKD80_04875, partial [Selenomonadaceae bacterium]|nr:hypothetical protein [Selenomonadaceae bacterium]
MKNFFVTICAATMLLTGCGQSDSPEAALNEISIALAERDAAKLSERVDLDEFFSATYDTATVELAARYDDYKARYPDDP